MKKKIFMKRIVTVALSLIMVIGLMPMRSNAAISTISLPYSVVFKALTQSENNTSHIYFDITDINAATVFLYKTSETGGAQEFTIEIDEGWYFDGWRTMFSGYIDRPILTDKEVEGENPKDDAGNYIFWNVMPTQPYLNEKTSIMVDPIYNWYGSYTINAILKPIVTVNAGDGVTYTLKTNNPTTISENQTAVKYKEDATITYQIDEKYVFISAATTGTKDTDTSTFGTVKLFATEKPTSVGIYTRLKRQNVIFNSNGGSGTMASQTFEHSVAQTLTANSFTRTGYLFDGWNTSADGSGTAYGDKAATTFTPINDGDSVTLYAQWAECTGHSWVNGICELCGAGCSTHSYIYSSDGDTITEGCANGCTHNETATISAPENKIYDGMAKEAIITYSDNWQGGTLSATYGENGNINVGTVTATIEKNGKKASVTYNIVKADPSYTPVGALSAIYGQVLADVTLPDGWTWENPNEKVGNVGDNTFTAIYTPSDTLNFNPIKTDLTIKVGKATVTVTADEASKTYGDSDPALTYSNTALVGGDTLDITVSRESGENAGDYTITASQAEGANPNYDIIFVSGTFTINKAVLNVTVEDKIATYGDAIPSYTVKYDGFVNGEDKNVLGGTLAFDCDYAQFDGKGKYTIKAEGYTSDNYDISYVDGELIVSPKPITVTIQPATSIYGENIAELKATDNGIVNGDTEVYSLATTATSTSNVGKYAITGTAKDDNYAITFANEADAYEIIEREITITVDAKNVVVNTALPTYTYRVEGLIGEDKLVTEPTFTTDADIAVIGEYDITAKDADAGSNYFIKYVSAKLTVLTDNAVDAAKGYEEELKDYDPDTVTSDDKAELDEILDEINILLDDEIVTDNGKKALEEVKEQVEGLIKEITDAEAATDTENTEKVKNTTSENVTPEDKADLEKAAEDLEKALEEHGNNMTEDEKKAVEDEIKRIDDALTVIGNVENVEELIEKIPNIIKKEDADAIKAADDAYSTLSDYEKSLVDDDVKKALDDAKTALAELNKPADTTSPNTGDNSNIFLWIALLFISGGAVITLTVVDRKKRIVKNK